MEVAIVAERAVDPERAGERCVSGYSCGYDHSTTTSRRSRSCASGCASPPTRRPPQEIEARRAAGYRALDALERGLGDEPFLVGARYSIADIALYAYTHVAPEAGFDLEPLPAHRGVAGSRRGAAAPHPDHRLTTRRCGLGGASSRRAAGPPGGRRSP